MNPLCHTRRISSIQKTVLLRAATMLFSLALSISAWPFQDKFVKDLGYAKVRGKADLLFKSQVYLNIPFAQAPVGNLRFKPPQPPLPTKQVLDATSFGPACSQVTGIFTAVTRPKMSEDCLQLNVFTPLNASPDANLPVIVFVYGGSFDSGYGPFPLYDGRNILRLDTQAVIVTMNYRVGSLGFLASKELQENDGLNLGLLDQKMAFEWVRTHIAKFGGNPKNVMAFGESAGAISIGFHMISGEGDQKLFDKVYLASGAPALLLRDAEAKQATFDSLISKLNCTLPAYECLMQADTQKILDAGNGLGFGITLDNKYIKRQAFQAYQQDKVSLVPALINTNKDEGTFFAQGVNDFKDVEPFWKSNFGFLNNEEHQRLFTLYPAQNYAKPLQQAGAAQADYIFNCPALSLAQYLAKHNVPVYKTLLDRQLFYLGVFLKDYGVVHASDLPLEWQFDLALAPLTKEKDLARQILKSYMGFANGKTDLPDYSTGNILVWDTPKSNIKPEIDYSERCGLFDAAVTRAF
ncbi:Carboxylesterase [Gorgonomyces haynaldii]|nr:Carboxylesterase [Gorgonomyces haynaldii]